MLWNVFALHLMSTNKIPEVFQNTLNMHTFLFEYKKTPYYLWVFFCVVSTHKGSPLVHTVKSSNFVTLLDENIFFRQTSFTSPLKIFRYWNLYRWGLGTGQAILALADA